MPDAMLGVGAVGSPVDVATLLVLLVLYRHEVAVDMGTLAAGLVALAREHRGVDDDVLQQRLEVDERQVDAVRPNVVDGGTNGGEKEC